MSAPSVSGNSRAAVVIGGIGVVDLAEDYCVGHQRAKTVRKPSRDQKLISVVSSNSTAKCLP